jgi:hypothetical protein
LFGDRGPARSAFIIGDRRRAWAWRQLLALCALRVELAPNSMAQPHIRVCAHGRISTQRWQGAAQDMTQSNSATGVHE